MTSPGDPDSLRDFHEFRDLHDPADAGNGGRSEPAAPTRPTVLVVDDDPTVGRMVCLTLEIEGIEVLAAETVAEGRRLLRPDLVGVVLDRLLPDGDGLELLPDLEQRCPGVPVVVYSGAVEDGREPPHVQRVAKSDVARLFAALGLGG